MYKIGIIGTGRVGTTLAIALQHTGHTILFGATRDALSAKSLLFQARTGAPLIPFTDIESLCKLLQQVQVLLLTTADNAILSTSEYLATCDMLQVTRVALHTAGALTSEALAPLAALGIACGSMHPLQTFADIDTALAALPGTHFAVEGHPDAVHVATTFINNLGGQPLHLDGTARVRYHAAAVLASNAITALASVAVDTLDTPRALEALLPLLNGAVRALFQRGLPDALTGPIERGDIGTVKAHLAALRDRPQALDVYRSLGRVTAHLALKKGSLTEAQYTAFMVDLQTE